MNVIAFTGPQGVGKTVTSNVLVEMIGRDKAIRISLADGLRDFAQICFGSEFVALTKDRNKKDSYLDYEVSFGTKTFKSLITPREVLIKLGDVLTTMNKDVFCEITHDRIVGLAEEGYDLVLIDDLRKPREHAWFNALPYNNYVVSLDRSDITLPSISINDYIAREDVLAESNGYAFDLDTYDIAANVYSIQNKDAIATFLNDQLDIQINYDLGDF